jgi:hypothetical protein
MRNIFWIEIRPDDAVVIGEIKGEMEYLISYPDAENSSQFNL